MNLSPECVSACLSFPVSMASLVGARALRRIRVALTGTCLLLLLGAVTADAQTASVNFAGAQTAIQGLFTEPSGVAVDAAGNLFIADSGNNQILEIPANCTSSACQVVAASGVTAIQDVALDAAGDFYVVTFATPGEAIEIPSGCTTSSCWITIAGGISNPQSLALDKSGDVFIAESGNNTVLEIKANCSGVNCAIPLGSGWSGPTGVAVDTAGDVFVADNGNSRVVEIPAGCTGCQTILASGVNFPTGVAVDGAGDVFFTTGNSTAEEIPADCASCQISIASGLFSAQNLTVDPLGDVFIADTFNGRVVEEQLESVGFGTVNVGSNSSLTLQFSIAANITLGTTPSVVTQGAPGLDFESSGTPTCTGAQTAGSTCTVTVQFAPLAPGSRKGAVQLFDSSGNLQATVFLQGTGSAPQLAFNPGVQSTGPGGLAYPFAVAVDAAGDLFAGYSSNQVARVPAGCTSSSCFQQLGNGIGGPLGVAVDGAGNVFIADYSGGRVVEVPASCVPTNSCQETVASGLQTPEGIAVDGRGNLFIADTENGELSEVPPGCTSSLCTISVASENINPIGVAVDSAGDLFFSEISPNQVLELPLAQAGFGSALTIATGLGRPDGVALDGAGDVYIADSDSTSVLEIPIGGSAQTALGSGVNTPSGLAVDGAGDVFVAGQGAQGLVELQRSQASQLSFGTVLDGSSSTAQTVAIQNVGNLPLTFTSFTVTNSFRIDSGTTTCSTSSSLAPGAACNIGVICSPTTYSGTLSGTLSLFDNTLNQSQGKQEVALSCMPAGQAPQITSGNSTTFTVGTAGSFPVASTGLPTASLTTGSGTLPTGVIFTDNHDGTATLSGTPAANTGGVYSFNIVAANNVSPNATQSFTLTVNQPPQITSMGASTFTAGTAGVFAVTAKGYPTATLSENGTLPSGITLVDNHNGTATLSGTPAANEVGSYGFTIIASNGVSPNATQSFTLTVNQASQIISFPLPAGVPASGNVTYGVAPIVLGATATSGLPVTYLVAGPAKLGGTNNNILTITGIGQVKVTASQNGNLDYSGATPVSQSFSVGKAVLLVAANNQTRVAGTANATLTYNISGYVDGDKSAVVTGTATLTTTAVTTSLPNRYPITFSTESLMAANYSFTYLPGILTVTAPPAPAPPGFSVLGGTYRTAQTIKLSDTTAGATIYYTINGATPTAASTPYTVPIVVSAAAETIKAVVIYYGSQSQVITEIYAINPLCDIVDYAAGFNSTGLMLNGGAKIVGTALELTDGNLAEARSAFTTTQQPSASFITNFTFQITNPIADGITFVWQTNNDHEVGGNGGGLGYASIPNSEAVKFDIYNDAGEGTDSTGFYRNGATPSQPSINLASTGINLRSGHIFAVQITYNGTTGNVTITDTATKATYSFSAAVPPVSASGQAYVGFTSATGSNPSTAQILTWTYSGSNSCPAN